MPTRSVIRGRDLEAKPAPDTILTACELLAVDPGRSASFETTVDGLEASRSAKVAIAIAVDRDGRAQTLRAHGAHVIVGDLAELLDPRG